MIAYQIFYADHNKSTQMPLKFEVMSTSHMGQFGSKKYLLVSKNQLLQVGAFATGLIGLCVK